MDYTRIISGRSVDLTAMLECRSRRVERQQALLAQGGECLVSFSMNIPGSVKQFPLADRAFRQGWNHYKSQLPEGAVLVEEAAAQITGSEGLLLLNCDPKLAKTLAIHLEEEHPLGRLFDIDVLGRDGIAVSRRVLGHPERACLICGRAGKACARSRTHSVELMQERIAQMLDGYFRSEYAAVCTACAARAMLSEVSATPKPGLVDRSNSGAHPDMDFFTFMDSTAALTPYFGRMFRRGWEDADLPIAQFFPRLRALGRRAEETMNRATHGANTHKGLIFSMGILCASLGRLQSIVGDAPTLSELLSLCGELGQCALGDFAGFEVLTSTAGMALYQTSRTTGARGEAASGFATVAKVGRPYLRQRLDEGFCLNDAAVLTLLALLAETEDTNMITRGGAEKATACRMQAKLLLKTKTPAELLEELPRLDEEYTRENLSPGGCADLLALTLMLTFLEERGAIRADKA